MGKKKKPTLNDIAKATGVAISTVSRVFSGKAKISKETTKRIIDAANEIGFEIKSKSSIESTRTIAFIVYYGRKSMYENPFFISSIQGAYDYCNKNDFSLQIHFCEKLNLEMEIIAPLVEKKLVDGIILSTVSTNESVLNYLIENKFPFSVIGRPTKSSQIIWVDNDNFNATYNIVSSLFNHGKTRVAFIGKDLDYHFAEDRFNGYKQAFTVRGFSIKEELIFLRNDDKWKEFLNTFLMDNEIDAIVTDDDEMALEVLTHLNEKNLNLPIISFNYMPFPKQYFKQLSLIDIRPKELGYWSAKMLIDFINGSASIQNRLIPINIDIKSI